MNKTRKYSRVKSKKRKVNSKKRKVKTRKYSKKAGGGKDYYDPKLWAYQNVAKHRDEYMEYPEKKAILKHLPDDLIDKILGATPPKSIHGFLKEDIERVAEKMQRRREREKISRYESHKYRKPKRNSR
jgi:hypothetical protein